MRLAQATGPRPPEPDTIVAETAGQASDTREPPQQNTIQPPPLPAPPVRAGLSATAPVKEKKAADELAAMILRDLSEIEGCPKRGVKVAVYGCNPWNSWLSFGGEAGPVPNKAELQGFCEIITERLKRLYDVVS